MWTPDDIASRLSKIKPDVVHLHWTCHGFMQVETLKKITAPIVWTLHDMWPMTGGCHYSESCTRFEDVCGQCPHLGSNYDLDLSRLTWKRKEKAWRDISIRVVAPSRWMADQAQRSSLLGDQKTDIIPNALDETVFRPIRQSTAREILNLSGDDADLLLFGALGPESNPRKGFSLLQEALTYLSDLSRQDFQLAIFGKSESGNEGSRITAGVPTKYLGRLDDNTTLALAYSTADVMIVPSRRESFGQTASEALACGTPVAAFNTSGLRDVVDHKKNGYLADVFDSKDLAQGIRWILEDQTRHRRLSDSARKKAKEKFSYHQVAQAHQTLYGEVCERGPVR
jgi:glycosyltransferase involved in cell wall biosynthesis